MRKYHPGCSPGKGGAAREPGARNTKASKEADEVVAMYRSAITKVALGVSVFDKYDAFVIMANLDACCSNLHGVLMRYDKFRTECLAVKGGGSMFGLVIAHLFIAAPIAAHHGLIPGKHIPKLLIDMPFTLFALMERMKEGEESLTRMMKEQYEQARKSQEEREKGKGKHDPYFPGAGGSTVGPS
jgi:hypothetical protein